MEGMKQYPDKYFDLAIVDPPYGINAGKMTIGSGKHHFTQGKTWDEGIPDAEYFAELSRVSKRQVIWGGKLLHRISQAVCKLDRLGQTKSEPILRGG